MSQGPSQPCAPNTRTKARPATTGETENGRSMAVTSTCLPRNSNFAIAHAAATPNTMLSGTATAAASRVSRIAASASGSLTAASQASAPRCKASREYRDERQHDEEPDEPERHGRQQQPHPDRFGRRPRRREERRRHHTLRCCHFCSRLTARIRAKDTASMTVAIAAAPA